MLLSICPAARPRTVSNCTCAAGWLFHESQVTRHQSRSRSSCDFPFCSPRDIFKRTEWHKIVVWGKQAEIAQQYLKKGSLIFIEGRIQSREWQDKEGQKRTSFEIVATNFRMLGGRAESAAAGAGGAGAAPRGGDDFDQSAPAEESLGGGGGPAAGPEISDEDIPF